MTARLRRQIEHDFPSPGSADSVASLLEGAVSGNQDHERVLAAVVFIAAGDIDRLRSAIELSQRDWRDVLVGGGLANGDWPTVLDDRLGPSGM